jgi:pSer/pThr/pTyr-binding forkhead associated (FHA) protein
MEKTLYIQIIKDGTVLQTTKFAKDNIIIGSGPAAHLRLDDELVSRIHAMIKVEEDGSVILNDSGWSEEGTMLNGVLIEEDAVLSDGDELLLGSTQLRIFTNPPEVQSMDVPPTEVSSMSEDWQAELASGDDPFAVSAEDDPFAVGADSDPFASPSAEYEGAVEEAFDSAFVAEEEPVYVEEVVEEVAFEEPEPIYEEEVVEEVYEEVYEEPVYAEEVVEEVYEEPAPVYVEEVVEEIYEEEPVYAEPVAEVAVDAYDEIEEPGLSIDDFPPSFRANMLEDDDSQGKRSCEIAFRWNGTTVDLGHFEKPRVVTVGPHPLNDFAITDEYIPEDKNYPILLPVGGSFGVFFNDKFSGHVEYADGRTKTIEEIRPTLEARTISGMPGFIYPVAENEVLHLKASELEIVVQFVYPTQKNFAAGVQKDRNFLYWRFIAFSAIVHLAMILSFQFVPYDTKSLGDQVLKGRFTKMIVVPPPKIVKKQEKKFTLKKEKKIEKKVVKTDDSNKKDDGPVDQKMSDDQRVKKTGLLGLLSSGMGDMGPGGDLFGKANQQQFLGKLLGASSGGTAFGLAGSGRGFGSGGGGGAGMYGGGGGWGYGGRKRVYGRRGMSLRGRGRSKSIVRINPGRLILKGALSKREIARVIRMYWAQIKFCYERQLMKNPKLAGKIVVRWKIGGNGSVTSASVVQTTMNNERVENCITRRIGRWRFPKPRGGGSVNVNYPFIFRVSG